MAQLSGATTTERWRIHQPADRHGTAGEWERILASTHIGFDVRFGHRTPARFQGSVVRRRFGELTLVDCVCAPFSGHHALIQPDVDDSTIGFQTVRRGTERVRHKSGENTVTAGQAVLWDGSQPVDVDVVEPLVKRTLILPRERVLAVCPRVGDPRALLTLGENPSARLLSRYLSSLADEIPRLAADDPAIRTMTDIALELLRATIEPSVPGDRAAAREAQRADVRRYIREHLQDPRLCPESIARAHALSLRSLHALFEGTGESVAAFVRRSRLTQCHADLELPNTGTVTEIALRWGFPDAAHFSTAFKREFGRTPRDVRRDASTRARIGN